MSAFKIAAGVVASKITFEDKKNIVKISVEEN